MGKALFSDYFYQPSISFMQQITNYINEYFYIASKSAVYN